MQHRFHRREGGSTSLRVVGGATGPRSRTQGYAANLNAGLQRATLR
jgi:hypothetical protein